MIEYKGIFKLFNVSLVKLKDFLNNYPQVAVVSQLDGEVKVEYDLNSLSIALRDKFYKGFLENFGSQVYATYLNSFMNPQNLKARINFNVF